MSTAEEAVARESPPDSVIGPAPFEHRHPETPGIVLRCFRESDGRYTGSE